MSPEAELMLYTIASLPGMSGAPVSAFDHGIPTVVGIHLAGLTQEMRDANGIQAGSAWAVAIAPIVHAPSQTANLNAPTSWPTSYAAPDIRQGDEKYYDETARDAALEDSRTRILFGASIGIEPAFNGSFTYSPGFHFSTDYLRLFNADSNLTADFDMTVAFRRGRYGFHLPTDPAKVSRIARDVNGLKYSAGGAICIVCRSGGGLKWSFVPLGLGWLHGTDERGDGINVITLSHATGLKGFLMAGPVRLFLSAEISAEIGVWKPILAPYEGFFIGGFGIEGVVKNWNPIYDR
jgi:hypothetical protein